MLNITVPNVTIDNNMYHEANSGQFADSAISLIDRVPYPTLVGQGVAIPGLTNDFDGAPRPHGAGTIRAHEFGAQQCDTSPETQLATCRSGEQLT
jgi:hypothetical protein